jgi:hypothetical protein
MDFPSQVASSASGRPLRPGTAFDMRDWLEPRRLTMVMWDQTFLFRHVPGGPFEDYDRVLDEAIERGYNTLRLDPLPQLLDLSHPEKVFSWPKPQVPYLPWGRDRALEAPVAEWLIEFMEKLLRRGLHYTLSAWWSSSSEDGSVVIGNHLQGAELWRKMLDDWKRRFGFEGLVYVDLVNEIPFFLPGFLDRIAKETGVDWFSAPERFTKEQVALLVNELNPAMAMLREAFPELRFTGSCHGDMRWLDVPVPFDCLDVHFYADADPAWTERTRFRTYMPRLFKEASWHSDFSQRCQQTHRSIAPMLRARQRAKVAAFAAWANERGTPLTTSESWASWYYYDSPDLDWGWLLEWAEWSVEDAIEFGMWGWTPHNYCQPQFANWKDVRWHRRLTDRFLRS